MPVWTEILFLVFVIGFILFIVVDCAYESQQQTKRNGMNSGLKKFQEKKLKKWKNS